ncbi:unnamed protein product [Mesocestoides corti]|uniref:Uncharacterized protein n=2 Tax=Mesocestoides corti TaxID=53468 RepID=A0A0R3UC75_MESCO|nr:unnamed protein product [Mesocestoides corti]
MSGMKRHLLPAIALVLSRAQIMKLVQQLDSVDLLNEVEKKEVNSVLHKCLSTRLEACDKEVSQVILLQDLAVRGIAFHHSGMMPLLKELARVSSLRPSISYHIVMLLWSRQAGRPAGMQTEVDQ